MNHYGAVRTSSFDNVVHYRTFAGPLDAIPAFYLCPYLENIPVLNQGNSSECVCFSSVHAHLWHQMNENKDTSLGSPSWLYGETHNVPNPTEGTEPRAAFQIMLDVGLCTWKLDPFPSDMQQTAVQARDSIRPDMGPVAEKYKISGYGIVPISVHDMATALQNGPVLVDSAVYKSFEYPATAKLGHCPSDLMNIVKSSSEIFGVIPGSWEKEDVLGYHQYVVDGILRSVNFISTNDFNKVEYYYICTNSWGYEWASGGHFILPSTYPIEEAWSIKGLA